MKRIKKVDAKRIVSWAGTLLMVVSLGFIVHRIMTDEVDFSWIVSPAVIAGLAGVAFVEGLVMTGASVNFRALLKNISGVKVALPLAVIVYLTSNLYKYIPGGVMYVAGRHRMAVETEALSHPKLIFSTVVEGAFIVIGAIIVATALSFEYVRRLDIFSLVFILLVAVPLVCIPILYLFRRKLSRRIKQLWEAAEIFKPSVLAKRLGFAVLMMFFGGFNFLMVMMLLGQPMTLSLASAIIGIALVAWLAGFLTPGAPSGLGIREAVLLLFLSGVVYESILLAAVVVHRIAAVIGDVSAYLIGLGYSRYAKRWDSS